ncbi:MAG: FAD-binding protein [candidate division Zixibacteria bacterium]|nr:FAD-binding protein [candidate division Zixibacteria bacterium]
MDRERLTEALAAVVGRDGVVDAPDELIVYECDGLTIDKNTPHAVVFPISTEQVSQVVRLLYAAGIPFVARGAGTGLSGGSLPPDGGVMISLTRMNRIVEIDVKNQRALVEAGVVNLHLSKAVAKHGYHYVPDPSSQYSCTIGGNIAENSGGPHTLKYGVTTNHTLGIEVVLPDGQVVWLGGKTDDTPGYDLRGVVIGSEGMLGIVTRAYVRLTRLPQTYRTFLVVYDDVRDASNTVAGLIAASIVPAALEMLDKVVIGAVEAAFHFGFPLDAEAVLIIELDGLEAGIDTQAGRVREVCQANHARDIRMAKDDQERTLLWTSRKRAFGALGRLSPSYYTQDGVVPRTKLPEIMKVIEETRKKYNLMIGNVFHAGDGNIHPCIAYDERDPEQTKKAVDASGEILKACVEMGGSITGEHGIGIEKVNFMPLIFTDDDLDAMESLKQVFDAKGLCNPGKVFPTNRSCIGCGTIELNQTSRQAAL